MKKMILGLLVCASCVFADEVDEFLKTINLFKLAIDEAPYKLNDRKCEALNGFVWMMDNRLFSDDINKFHSRYGVDADKAYNLLNVLRVDMREIIAECSLILAGQSPQRWKELPKNFKHSPLFTRDQLFKSDKEVRLEKLREEVRDDFERHTSWYKEIFRQGAVWFPCKKAKKATQETLAFRAKVENGEIERYKGVEKEAVEKIDERLKDLQNHMREYENCKDF